MVLLTQFICFNITLFVIIYKIMENNLLPKDLLSYIGAEQIDFVVKSTRANPGKNSFSLMTFGLIWCAFTSIFVIGFFGPLFTGQEVHFESNGVPVVASLENFGPLIMPALIIGAFVLVGVFMLSSGFLSLFKKGGYFVGTPTRLINFKKGNITSIDWEQFTGDMKINGDDKKGDLALQLRGGFMQDKHMPSTQGADIIYIIGVPNIFEIQRICKERIKENDPTPVKDGKSVI